METIGLYLIKSEREKVQGQNLSARTMYDGYSLSLAEKTSSWWIQKAYLSPLKSVRRVLFQGN